MVKQALVWFSGLSESRIHALRVVTLSYAAVFAVEGVGLWMQRRWAEWLTCIITASLIPLELWELIHRPTIGKAAVLLANIAIAGISVLARVDPPQDAAPLGLRTFAGAPRSPAQLRKRRGTALGCL